MTCKKCGRKLNKYNRTGECHSHSATDEVAAPVIFYKTEDGYYDAGGNRWASHPRRQDQVQDNR